MWGISSLEWVKRGIKGNSLASFPVSSQGDPCKPAMYDCTIVKLWDFSKLFLRDQHWVRVQFHFRFSVCFILAWIPLQHICLNEICWKADLSNWVLILFSLYSSWNHVHVSRILVGWRVISLGFSPNQSVATDMWHTIFSQGKVCDMVGKNSCRNACRNSCQWARHQTYINHWTIRKCTIYRSDLFKVKKEHMLNL